jgi:hypothetical protein
MGRRTERGTDRAGPAGDGDEFCAERRSRVERVYASEESLQHRSKSAQVSLDLVRTLLCPFS